MDVRRGARRRRRGIRSAMDICLLRSCTERGLGEFSRESVGEQLLNAGGQRERLGRLSAFLRAHVDGARPEDLLVTESLRLIHHRIRSIKVPQLLKYLNLSERQFERRFLRAVGL